MTSRAERRRAQDVFLQAYARTGSKNAACVYADIHRNTPNYWKRHDPSFKRRYEVCMQMWDSDLLDEVRRRLQGGLVFGDRALLKAHQVTMDSRRPAQAANGY